MSTTNSPKKHTVTIIILASVFIIISLSCVRASSSISEMAPPEEAIIVEIEETPVAALASLKITSQLQEDGNTINLASLSLNSLGIGTLQLETPDEMDIHETSMVKLSLGLTDEFTSLPSEPAADTDSDLPPEVLKYTDQIDIYPVMSAELIGSGFEISSNDSSQKVILSNAPVEWMWSIRPKDAGSHSLTIVISIPVVIDEQRNILSTHVLQNIPVVIEVTETFGSKLAGALPWLIPVLVSILGGLISLFITRDRRS